MLAEIGFVSTKSPVQHVCCILYDAQMLFVCQLNITANANSANLHLVKAVLCAALYPRIIKFFDFCAQVNQSLFLTKALLLGYRVIPPAGKMLGKQPPKLATKEDGRVSLHPKSVLANEVFDVTWFILQFAKYDGGGCFFVDGVAHRLAAVSHENPQQAGRLHCTVFFFFFYRNRNQHCQLDLCA